jgi:hypothetical protein
MAVYTKHIKQDAILAEETLRLWKAQLEIVH